MREMVCSLSMVMLLCEKDLLCVESTVLSQPQIRLIGYTITFYSQTHSHGFIKMANKIDLT